MAKHTSLFVVYGVGCTACGAPDKVYTLILMGDQLLKPASLSPAVEAPLGPAAASTTEEAHRLVIEAVAIARVVRKATNVLSPSPDCHGGGIRCLAKALQKCTS